MMEHVTFDRMPAALGTVLARLEGLERRLDALAAALPAAPPTEGAGRGLLTFAEACAHLSVCRNTLSRWKRAGIVPHLRVGTRTYFRRADLEAYNRTDVRPSMALERARRAAAEGGGQ